MTHTANIRTGLVSVTFRKLAIAEIVALSKRAGVVAIEWGGDVHVPPGDAAASRTAKAACDAAGVAVSAYGSYYSAGSTPPVEFDAILATARQLGAPTIRVWAGKLASASADADHVGRVTDDLRRICDLAAAGQISITVEYHGGTLTDTIDSTVRLLEAVDRPNLLSGWQPRDGATADSGAAEIRRLRPWLGNIHVFQWWPTGATRHPLADGADRWEIYFRTIAEDGRERFALLEFVKDDEPEQFVADARMLQSIIDSVIVKR